MYAIVDCNNFFVSCERVFNPKLVGKPTVVLSNNDGCVIARSNEAKLLGIPMGEPFFKVKDIVRSHGVRVLSSNHTLYGDMSQRVMNVLDDYSADVEHYSIDEAFLDVSWVKPNDLKDYAKELREKVFKWTGIPVSVGIGPTKTLAKLANFTAKKCPGAKGVYILNHPEVHQDVLQSIDVGEVWGVGRRWKKFLKKHGILTADDLRKAEVSWAQQHMSVVGARVVQELRGTSCIPLDMMISEKKSITVSRSFGKKVTQFDPLREALTGYVTRAAEKLRQTNQVARHMTVYIRTGNFVGQQTRYTPAINVSLPHPTSYTPDLIQHAVAALRKIYKSEYAYKKAGVVLSDFIAKDKVTPDLFDERDTKKQDQLMGAIDFINLRQGKGVIHFAGSNMQSEWKAKREFCSPAYTTSWEEIPRVA